MNLRQRIVLTLILITVFLALPAAFALFGLRDLQTIAQNLKTRDAEALLALGRLQRSITTVENSQRNYVALAAQVVFPAPPRDTAVLRTRADSAAVEVDAALRTLAQRGYRASAEPAARQWEAVRGHVRTERSLIEEGRLDEQEAFRRAEVTPGFRTLDELLDPIGRAIDEVGLAQVQRAEEVAGRAATTTLLALAGALAVTMVIGAWLTRGVLRPIRELRVGMSHVAEGDFEPDVRLPLERPDEVGDLARSFRSMAEQLQELDRLKAEFVSVASHEIKTPLSVIRGYVTLLADGIYGGVNDEQKKTLEAVSAQTDRLARLVHRLLDISRFEAGGGRLELREIALRRFFDELTSDFRVLARQNGIDFPVTVAEDLPETIVADEDRLSEVLGNLLSNAFKFTGQGGTIRVDAAAEDGGVRIVVEDSGVGIPPDKLPRIFEKFYQVENEAQPRSVGSGLGLAIAREIVEAHGGTIGADSEVGRGTRFVVHLPVRPSADGTEG
jgi:signal transduction histidine kinase